MGFCFVLLLFSERTYFHCSKGEKYLRKKCQLQCSGDQDWRPMSVISMCGRPGLEDHNFNAAWTAVRHCFKRGNIFIVRTVAHIAPRRTQLYTSKVKTFWLQHLAPHCSVLPPTSIFWECYQVNPLSAHKAKDVGALEILKTHTHTHNIKPHGTLALTRCTGHLPWVWNRSFIPSLGISLSPAHLSSVPVSGIWPFQMRKTVLTELGKWKKFLVMEIPTILNWYFIHVWKRLLVAVSISICFGISCFNSETKCITNKENLGLIPELYAKRDAPNNQMTLPARFYRGKK